MTVSAGYQKNFNDRAHQFTYGASVPVPIFKRNQGIVMATKAEIGGAVMQLKQTQHSLLKQLAVSYGRYSAAAEQAERFRHQIIPKAKRAYELSLKAIQGGQFEYLRVIRSQRAVASANRLDIQSLGPPTQPLELRRQ